MSEDLHKYIRQARQSGADHRTIRDQLVNAGWHPRTVNDALHLHQDGPKTGSAPSHNSFGPANTSETPIAVVQALSTRGVEYYLLIISLAFSAISLGLILHSLAAHIFSDTSAYSFGAGTMMFASSALIVSLPIFAFLFLRLKKAELRSPRLLLDPSRRRAIQILLITTFVIGLISAIGYVFTFFSLSYGGTESTGSPIGLIIADFIITTLIVGGIFIYYWLESHQKEVR